jgi:hypothetical protein
VSRLEKITAFLGLLEMLKAGSVQVAQEELFGPIWVEWRGEAGPEVMLEEDGEAPEASSETEPRTAPEGAAGPPAEATIEAGEE